MVIKKKKDSGCRFLGIGIPGINKDTIIKNIAVICILSVITKIFVLFMTTSIFHSFVDLFDISYYLEYAVNISQGQIPYLDFHIDYPILFLIPVLLPLPFALMTNDAMTYVYSYQAIMSIFDILTAVLIYFIALKLYDKKTALISALMYSTAFSAGYFILTKFDSFPVFLLMLTIFFTVYGMKSKGYIANILAFFAKIFPIIALPFIAIYNSRDSSLKDEIIKILKFGIPIGLILFIPLFLLKPEILNTYLFATGYSVSVYVNTATYTIFSVLTTVGLPISAEGVSAVMYVLMAVFVLGILGFSWFKGIKTEKRLLIVILLTIFSLIFFTKFHSPQYITWITPFFALLMADSIRNIILFYVGQAVFYMEFPLFFNRYYTNLEYTALPGTGDYYFIILFFAAEYIILLSLIYLSIKSDKSLASDVAVTLNELKTRIKSEKKPE
jgi:hypothetical protein